MGGTFNASAFTEDGQYDPDFDPSRVFKTQTHEDVRRNNRRAARMAQAQADADVEDNFWAKFFIVSGVLILGVTVGTLAVNMSNQPRGGMLRGDGSRRDGPRNEWTKG